MARPEKQGLDYFSHDVDLSNDEKIQLIEAEYGLIGYAIIIKLFERIYRNGYYLKCNEKFIKLFSKNNNIEINVCKNIINDCINEGLFNQQLYKKYEILTSCGIQKRYFEAVKRRKEVEIIEDFILININDNINLINVDINLLNDGNKKQSKVKESKVKESIYIEKFSQFVFKRLKFPVTNKKDLPTYFKEFSYKEMIQATLRMESYFKEVKFRKWKKFVYAKRWNKMIENINIFISIESLNDHFENMTKWNNEKQQPEEKEIIPPYMNDYRPEDHE